MLQDPVLNVIVQELGKTPAQVALQWGLQRSCSVLPKSSSEVRLEESFNILDWSIPDDLLTTFSEIPQASYQFLNTSLLSGPRKKQLAALKTCVHYAGEANKRHGVSA